MTTSITRRMKQQQKALNTILNTGVNVIVCFESKATQGGKSKCKSKGKNVLLASAAATTCAPEKERPDAKNVDDVLSKRNTVRLELSCSAAPNWARFTEEVEVG